MNHHALLLNIVIIEVHLIIEVYHDIEVHQTKEQDEGVYPMMIITRHHTEVAVRREVYIVVVIDG